MHRALPRILIHRSLSERSALVRAVDDGGTLDRRQRGARIISLVALIRRLIVLVLLIVLVVCLVLLIVLVLILIVVVRLVLCIARGRVVASVRPVRAAARAAVDEQRRRSAGAVADRIRGDSRSGVRARGQKFAGNHSAPDPIAK